MFVFEQPVTVVLSDLVVTSPATVNMTLAIQWMEAVLTAGVGGGGMEQHVMSVSSGANWFGLLLMSKHIGYVGENINCSSELLQGT